VCVYFMHMVRDITGALDRVEGCALSGDWTTRRPAPSADLPAALWFLGRPIFDPEDVIVGRLYG
jgi:hypothetical protein